MTTVPLRLLSWRAMLDQIISDVRAGLPALHDRAAEVMAAAATMPPARDFAAALAPPGLAIIAEIKRASPSRGVLDSSLDPAARAGSYEEGGAAAVSVLTEPRYFHGAPADLAVVRESVAVPVLRKDFTVDELQIWEARAMGADAVLLIVAALSAAEVSRFLEVAGAAGLAALVEVHNQAEAEIALAAGATIVGVNNRDLTTFDVDLATAEKIGPILAGVSITVAESGICTPEDARRMEAAGYDAILVGESLVTSGDPARAIRALRGA